MVNNAEGGYFYDHCFLIMSPEQEMTDVIEIFNDSSGTDKREV